MMMMTSCELCKSPATVYCNSDEASLCWTCDGKVHSANFLVARHSRSLLCRVCRSPTPWTASGKKLTPSAVSICQKCVVDGDSDGDEDREESEGGNDNDFDDDDDVVEDDGGEDGETELDVDEEDGDDNKVVPLAYPPPPSASSSSDDESVGDRGVLMKRKRENVADLSEDEIDSLSVNKSHRDAIGGNETTTFHRFLTVEKLKTNRHRNEISGEEVTGVCKQTKSKTVGSDRSDCR